MQLARTSSDLGDFKMHETRNGKLAGLFKNLFKSGYSG